MNLVADENVDRQVVERLRLDGHDVATSWDTHPGVDDDAILELARSRSALLVTADKDFGELVFRRDRAFYGVLLLRLPGLTPGERAERVSQVVSAHLAELAGAFTVIGPTATRIRRRL